MPKVIVVIVYPRYSDFTFEVFTQYGIWYKSFHKFATLGCWGLTFQNNISVQLLIPQTYLYKGKPLLTLEENNSAQMFST